jgi:hypothetical protein
MAHCINEDCNLPLHSLSEGRLFQFEIISVSLAATDESRAPFDEKPRRETVHFWLCGSCASNRTLVLEPVRGLRLVPLQDAHPGSSSFPNVGRENLQPREC